MDYATYGNVTRQLGLLMTSMARRSSVRVIGRDCKGLKHEVLHVGDVVNSVTAEDGSGKNYIVEFRYGNKLFIRLDNPDVVRIPDNTLKVRFTPLPPTCIPSRT